MINGDIVFLASFTSTDFSFVTEVKFKNFGKSCFCCADPDVKRMLEKWLTKLSRARPASRQLS